MMKFEAIHLQLDMTQDKLDEQLELVCAMNRDVDALVTLQERLVNLVKQLNGFRNLPYAADYDLWKGVLQFTDCLYIDKPLIYYDNSHGYGREYKK